MDAVLLILSGSDQQLAVIYGQFAFQDYLLDSHGVINEDQVCGFAGGNAHSRGREKANSRTGALGKISGEIA